MIIKYNPKCTDYVSMDAHDAMNFIIEVDRISAQIEILNTIKSFRKDPMSPKEKFLIPYEIVGLNMKGGI